MKKEDYQLIAMAIWRSGAIEDKNKVRQKAKEDRSRLIATDLASSLKADDPSFDKKWFLEACEIKK